ncbi:MAG: DegV family protein [Lachnospiraceae bacterium]|nr:DegV family protein [Lachnospiraceae bacterium]
MVKIISDSTCDLSKELTDRYNVDILPLHIILGEKEYEDGVDIAPEDIYKWSDENNTTPHTSASSLERAMETFKPYIDKGDDIIAFVISETMSTSGNVCRLAAEELNASDRIHVVDSKNLSTGIGHLVIEAAILAEGGKSADEILGIINALIPKVRASFVVDTLTYLHRGGRCSGLAAMAGAMLKLHPRIEVSDGRMNPGKKYRGKIESVIMDYTRDMEAALKRAKPDRVFITHSGCDEKIVDEVRSYLKSLNRFEEVLETRAGGVVSSHCGPGTLGVLFIEE